MGRVIEAESDRERPQEGLDRLHEWSLKWQMSFNAEKCKVLRLGRPNLDEKYKLDNTDLVTSAIISPFASFSTISFSPI